jgi:hypothetical protein
MIPYFILVHSAADLCGYEKPITLIETLLLQDSTLTLKDLLSTNNKEFITNSNLHRSGEKRYLEELSKK